MGDFSIDDLKRMFANPFYAINFDPGLFPAHEPLISKEEWVLVNLRMITEDDEGNKYDLSEEAIEAVKRWLHQLLDVLEGGYPRG